MGRCLPPNTHTVEEGGAEMFERWKVPGLVGMMVLLWSLARTAPTGIDQNQGELTVYPKSTENGTLAVRVFRDTHGRLLKKIYYTGQDLSHSVHGYETSLQTREIVLYEYDRKGRSQWEKHYTPRMTLTRTMETVHSTRGETLICRRPDQTKVYEIRPDTEIYFDDTGKRVIGLKGAIPKEVDLASGWGPTVEGLACGLGFERARGRLKDMRFYLTVRNLTDAPRKIITALPYHQMQLQLQDESGRLMPQDVGLMEKQEQEQVRLDPGTQESTRPIEAHQAGMEGTGYSLKAWYAQLPAGKYTLRVRRRAQGQDFVLVSPAVPFELQ